jgi:hypothetical protein
MLTYIALRKAPEPSGGCVELVIIAKKLPAISQAEAEGLDVLPVAGSVAGGFAILDSGLGRHQKCGGREEEDVVAEHGWMLLVAGLCVCVCGYVCVGGC